MQKGQISVNTENIFPIIKKFLYSEHEIFIRELVSNAVDASMKLSTLNLKGEVVGEIGDLKIEIIPNKEQKTLTIRDFGIGMTKDETITYLSQLAFSSAEEFLEKHKESTNIIGHFGLGFYSAFMVASKVEVLTQSYKQGSTPVLWTCTGNTEYEISEQVEKESRGSDIILHIDDDNLEFLEYQKIKDLLLKFCKFLPIPIYLIDITSKSEEGEINSTQINNTNPIWKKHSNELQDSDYIDFYKEIYPFSKEPIFWIHLNIDYPFNLTGILYFPKLDSNFEIQKNKIHLYSNQVFVTDDVKEIVPEYLTVLNGIIDSPDIPLNVSRSYLQADQNVRKITTYINKKVLDKIQNIFNEDRAKFESKWKEMGTFLKYGYLSDTKFEEKADQFLLLEDSDEKYYTLDEYKEKVKSYQTNKDSKLVFIYTNNKDDFHHYKTNLEQNNLNLLFFDQIIDNHFIQKLESKHSEIIFKRIDSEAISNLIDVTESESLLTESEIENIKLGLKQIVGENKSISIESKALSTSDAPITIVKPEFIRRMSEMNSLSGVNNQFDFTTLIVNTNHTIFSLKFPNLDNDDQSKLLKGLYLAAKLLNKSFEGKELTDFINHYFDLINSKS